MYLWPELLLLLAPSLLELLSLGQLLEQELLLLVELEL
jgi:hypothetical protein